MKLHPALSLLLSLLTAMPALWGATDAKPVIVREAKVVKAAYVYNFAKFIEWTSEEGGAAANQPFVICVLGTDPVGKELDEIGSLKAKGRPIKVLHIQAEEKIPACHILYIGASEEKRLSQILEQTKAAGVLLVSDLPGFAEQGGMIGFISERGRVLVHINVQQAQRAGLKISSKLLEIARIVPPKPS